MNGQETKDIQIYLHTTLLALSIRRDLGIDDANESISSSLTRFSSVSPQSSPPFDLQEGIPLHIAHWGHLAVDTVQSQDDGRLRVYKVFEYFVEAAKEFGLGQSPSVSILMEAMRVCSQAGPDVSQIPGSQRIAQKTRSTAPSHAANLRGFVSNEIPLFNVHEAICWIYTCCVESDQILTDREAELYLYQLHLIFFALKQTGWFGTKFFPTTIAAAWNEPSENAPLTLAFACAGVGKQCDIREEINAARRQYVQGLHALTDNCLRSGNSPNDPGNCPEFIAWGTVCRGEGTYRSLCLNIGKEMSYKCCSHCAFLARVAWEGKRLKIEDWFDKTSLIQGPLLEHKSYSGFDLKPIKVIIAEGRGRGVHRRH
jgi:hypothetical protein